jgi:hypothetical protein
MPKTTDAPVSFKYLQMILNRLGYGLSHHDQDKPIIHWQREGRPLPDGMKQLPEHITTLKPDFRADGYPDPVYDRSYVIDLIMNVTGSNATQAGHQLRAVLLAGDGEKEPY